jgi:hypothetical protein
MAEHEKSDTSLERNPHQAKQIVAQPAQKVPNTLRP